MSYLAFIATAGAGHAVGVLMWDLVAAVVLLVAAVRTLKLPARWWGHGRWSKVAAMVLSLWGSADFRGYFLPIGAGLVIWHVGTLAKRVADPVVPGLPFAEGGAEGAEEGRS